MSAIRERTIVAMAATRLSFLVRVMSVGGSTILSFGFFMISIISGAKAPLFHGLHATVSIAGSRVLHAVKIKSKSSGQECPLHTGNDKGPDEWVRGYVIGGGCGGS